MPDDFDWDEIAGDALEREMERKRQSLIAEFGAADAARITMTRGPLDAQKKCAIHFSIPDDLAERFDAWLENDSKGDG